MQNQISVSRWYIDVGRSGRSFDRSELQKMLKAIEQSEVDCVIVKDFSHLGRDHIMVGYYLEVFSP